MFCKTQLFHLNQLKPETIQEADGLHALIECTVSYLLRKSLLQSAYTISSIYCNRRNINSTMEIFPQIAPHKEAEYRQLVISLEQFIEGLVDSYYLLTVKKPNSILNLECSLVNRNTVAVSFDLY